jgi:hypothetical protein
MVPAILDDLVYMMERFPGILRYLAQQEGRQQLGMAATGVATRWGFYVDAVSWFQPMGRATPLPAAQESSDDDDDPMHDSDNTDSTTGCVTVTRYTPPLTTPSVFVAVY